jgi:D-aminoacyl-tRNA deacylase
VRVLLQRVSKGSVTVAGEKVSGISRGLVLLVGAASGDTVEEVRWLAHKAANLRIFEDSDGKMNLSLRDVGGEALVVSQFTLYADTQRGRRPSFVNAAPPEIAEPLVERFANELRSLGVPVGTGVFGAHMLVEIDNDGPVTIMLERDHVGDDPDE